MRYPDMRYPCATFFLHFRFHLAPSSLLAHLQTCHPRLRFQVAWDQVNNHLEVETSLNPNYDGSNDCSLPVGGSTSNRSVGGACALRSYKVKSAPSHGRLHIGLGETAASLNAQQLPVVGGWTGYDGGPEDVIRDLRNAEAEELRNRQGPARRLPYTHVIYWKGAERLVGQVSLTGCMCVRSSSPQN